MPTTLVPINGIVQNVSAANDDCCQQRVTIRNSQGVYNFRHLCDRQHTTAARNERGRLL